MRNSRSKFPETAVLADGGYEKVKIKIKEKHKILTFSLQYQFAVSPVKVRIQIIVHFITDSPEQRTIQFVIEASSQISPSQIMMSTRSTGGTVVYPQRRSSISIGYYSESMRKKKKTEFQPPHDNNEVDSLQHQHGIQHYHQHSATTDPLSQSEHPCSRTYSSDKNLNSNTNINISHSYHGGDVLICSCDASEIEQELCLLRESTSDALQRSWDEINLLDERKIERLQELERLTSVAEGIEQEQKVALVKTAKLQKEVERKQRRRLKETQKLQKRRMNSGGMCRRKMMTRKMSLNDLMSTCRLNQLPSMSMSKQKSHGNLLGGSSRNNSFDSVRNLPSYLLRRDHPISPVPNSLNSSMHLNNTMHTLNCSEHTILSCEGHSMPENMSKELDDEIHDLKMKIRQRDASIRCLESTMNVNLKLVEGMKSQLVEWMQEVPDERQTRRAGYYIDTK